MLKNTWVWPLSSIPRLLGDVFNKSPRDGQTHTARSQAPYIEVPTDPIRLFNCPGTRLYKAMSTLNITHSVKGGTTPFTYLITYSMCPSLFLKWCMDRYGSEGNSHTCKIQRNYVFTYRYLVPEACFKTKTAINKRSFASTQCLTIQ